MKTFLTLLMIMLSSLAARESIADGGTVRLLEQRNGQVITVFTSPNPLRAGPVDVSVLVQDKAVVTAPAGNEPHSIEVIAHPRDNPGRAIRLPATRAAATNKLLQAAKFELPDSGWWRIEVLVQTPGQPDEHLKFDVEAAPAQPRWVTFWPWFTWPAIAIALFGLHRRISRPGR